MNFSVCEKIINRDCKEMEIHFFTAPFFYLEVVFSQPL